MKFFVPTAKDNQQSEELYLAIVKFNSTIRPISNRRIYSIEYSHNGKSCVSEVGKHHPLNGEMIFSILESQDVYFICTLTRGFQKGDPILVGVNDLARIVDFDS